MDGPRGSQGEVSDFDWEKICEDKWGKYYLGFTYPSYTRVSL
jgi:hypothetical protein